MNFFFEYLSESGFSGLKDEQDFFVCIRFVIPTDSSLRCATFGMTLYSVGGEWAAATPPPTPPPLFVCHSERSEESFAKKPSLRYFENDFV